MYISNNCSNNSYHIYNPARLWNNKQLPIKITIELKIDLIMPATPIGQRIHAIESRDGVSRVQVDIDGIEWVIRCEGPARRIEEKNSVEAASGNSLVERNQRDRRMIEEDSSNGRWHLSHRLQSHGDGPRQGLAVKMDHRAARCMSSKRPSRVPSPESGLLGNE